MADFFREWTDETFWPWLVGYFERGGRIRLPPEKLTVYLSLWGRNESVLKAIQTRVDAGDVRARFTNPASYMWHVQRQPEVERVLYEMSPYLTTLRDAARDALRRFDRRRETIDRVKAARETRNLKILIAWEIGHESQARIAERLKTSPSIVAQVISRNRADQGITLRRPRTRIR